MPLKNKIALVTGAATGIGQEIAKTLAMHGAKVIVHYNQSSPEKTIEKIEALGGECCAVKADFSLGINEAIKLYKEAKAQFGNINILVNNAAVLYSEAIIDADEKHYDDMFLVNTKVPYFLCKEAIKDMVAGSRIVNVSSSGTQMILGQFSGYLTTKAALEQITRSLAVEAAETSITINAVAAGVTDTKMISCFSREELNSLAANTPLRRLGQPHDIAQVVAFLAMDKAAWMTGQVLHVNGGLI